MGISAILESLDDVSEDLANFYTQDEKSGAYVLDIDGIDAHPKVRGVINANKTNKETRDRLRAELDELKDSYSWLPEDFDADKFEQMREAVEKGVTTAPPSEEQLAEVRAAVTKKLTDQHTSELLARENRIGELESTMNRMVVDEGLSKALDAAYVDSGLKAAAAALLKQSSKIAVSFDGDKPTATVDTDLGPQSLSEFVSEWAAGPGQKFVAKSTGPSPKGGNGPSGSKTMTRAKFDLLPDAEKPAVIAGGTTIVD